MIIDNIKVFILNFKSNFLKIGVVIALIFILVPVIAAQDVDESVYSDTVDESVSVDEEASIELADDSESDSIESSDDSDYVIGDEEDSVLSVEDSADAVGEDASDDADDDVEYEDGEDAGDVAYDDHVMAAGDYDEFDDSSADLQVAVLSNAKYAKVGDKVKFMLVAYNDGPDTAKNVVVRYALYSGNVLFYKLKPTKGYIDSINGLWYIGDMEPGEYQFLYLEGTVLTQDDIVMLAYISSDTPDPIEDNNFASWVIDVESDVPEYSEEPQTMHETANPIALALLALVSLAGVSLKRKF
jgi:uncharacterized repeat protein (TIGR01451 family)